MNRAKVLNSRILLKCKYSDHKAWANLAGESGMPLTKWIRRVLNIEKARRIAQ
jgi:hypothetical protein